jgi:hypothetical protein
LGVPRGTLSEVLSQTASKWVRPHEGGALVSPQFRVLNERSESASLFYRFIGFCNSLMPDELCGKGLPSGKW